VPGLAAKHVEDKKFKTNADSPKHVAASHGARYTFVPSAMEDGGRIGAHEQATLRMLAEYAVAKGKLPPPPGGHCTHHLPLPAPGCNRHVCPHVVATPLDLVAPHPVPPSHAVPSSLGG